MQQGQWLSVNWGMTSKVERPFEDVMSGYYVGKVKVVGDDLMCFPARADDLEPLACGCYDPYAWSDPDQDPVETIDIGEWQSRRSEHWRKKLSRSGNK